MSDYGVKNCTDVEREKLRIQLHSYCQEGGYCRVMPPNKLYCQCLPGWKNDICDTPDMLGSMLGSANLKMVIVIPLVVLTVLTLIGVGIFLLVRGCRCEKESSRRRTRAPSGNCENGSQGQQDMENLA